MSSDILQQFADKLHTAGLVVDNIEVDGVLHRCGVGDKPNGKDGAYKAFLDAPPSLWWQNWQTGESGTWCEKSGKDMTVTEREALKKRIAEARVAAEQEKAERHAAAAQKAVRLWQSAKPAAPDYPYLTRKGVSPLGIRQLGGSLVVPVLAEDGTLMSLQFILPDGGKRFLSGGKTEGGFFSIPAKDGLGWRSFWHRLAIWHTTGKR